MNKLVGLIRNNVLTEVECSQNMSVNSRLYWKNFKITKGPKGGVIKIYGATAEKLFADIRCDYPSWFDADGSMLLQQKVAPNSW